MSEPTRLEGRVAVVLGARNLGGAIAAHLVDRGWSVAAVARSKASLENVSEYGVLATSADAADPASLSGALTTIRDELGGLDLMVNAVSAARPARSGGPFGGGAVGEATVEDFSGWAAAPAEQGFVFLSEGIRALRAAGGGGTLIQVTGGSARRGMPRRGLWAAGAAAQRAMVQAAAQEVREEGIHVALLIVDGTIASPKTASSTRDTAEAALAEQGLVAEAVDYLARQGARALTHELVLTPAGDRWTP
jgi:NAD(P)-dependent dehydrogenase (short-subunit alcohol dehydrogenase family)